MRKELYSFGEAVNNVKEQMDSLGESEGWMIVVAKVKGGNLDLNRTTYRFPMETFSELVGLIRKDLNREAQEEKPEFTEVKEPLAPAGLKLVGGTDDDEKPIDSTGVVGGTGGKDETFDPMG